jgi:outer membrane protein OmpA-like peptidoglycan-associated protein
MHRLPATIIRSALAAAVVAAGLAGCASSAGGGATRVTLLPDEGGKVGVITVSTATDTRTLSGAGDTVSVGGPGAGAGTALSATLTADPARLAGARPALFAAMPSSPSSHMLYFQTGTSEMTRESIAALPAILARVKDRAPTEVTIIGHTDTTGTDELNDRLAVERARQVEKLLRATVGDLGSSISIKSFGSKELLVPTGPNVSEPRNRRVEVYIL